MKSLTLSSLLLIGLITTGNAQEQPKMHEVGGELPNFELSDLNGKTWSLEDLKGKVVLLDFWYTSCPPCKMSNPKVQKLHEKYGEDGLVVLAVNAVDNTEERRPLIRKYKEKNKATYTVLLADKNLIKLLKVPAYPSFYILDREGKIKYAQGGYHPYVYKEMKRVIKDAL